MSKWYFENDGQYFGPVLDENFAEAMQEFSLTEDTMVCEHDIDGDKIALKNSALAYLLAQQNGGSSLTCSFCMETFPENEIIEIQGHKCCYQCKPIAVQQLQENSLNVSAKHMFAGFWIRVGAVLLDTLILSPIVLIPNIIMFVKLFTAVINNPGVPPDTSLVASMNLLSLSNFIIGFSYSSIMIWKYGGTLGMQIVKIKVIDVNTDENISYLKSVGRYFSAILSGIIIYIGYIMIAFDPEKRSLHDMICNTRVIHKTK